MAKTIVCTALDPVSRLVRDSLISTLELSHEGRIGKYRSFEGGNIRLVDIECNHIDAAMLDAEVPSELFVFPSVHASVQGIISFTTHPEGNWGPRADLGGKPYSISVAAPISMLSVLHSLSQNTPGPGVSYEATHHGPLLDTPSLFVEIGGAPDSVNGEYTKVVAKAIAELVLSDEQPEFDRIAVGIGSGHYPARFTALALEGKFAFSHIMSKYYTDNINMLEAAFSRSKPKAEVAVVEWKSIKSEERKEIIGRLDEIGIDYVKI
jgi:D-aminoacyl-tRNA deacylase